MESVNDMRIKNGLMLLLTAFIWGTAFVAQSVGMDYLEPFTFNGVRSLIGGAALLPCIWILQKLNGRSKDTGTKKDLFTGGLACGVLLFAASSLQQIGIKFAPKVDGVKMSCIQFFVCGILSVPFMFALETPKITSVMIAWMPILYAGVLSCGVAYTLQILGQKNVNPAVASLLLSLESCFSVLAGWIVLGERLSIREMSGCILMFAAIVLAQVPEKKKR